MTDWEERLAAPRGAAATLAAALAARAVADCNELFVGGDDSPLLLQLIGMRGDDGAVDFLATILAPGEGETPHVVFTSRGASAIDLVACFWESRPSAPLLLASQNQYLPLHCELPDKPWTRGPLCAERVAALQRDDDAERLLVLFPAATSA
jgi:hypothetical protein